MNKLVLVLSVFFLGFSNPFRPVHFFMIGDFTIANKPEEAIPEYVWGQVLHYNFNNSLAVDNHARNGRSSKSFIDEGRWAEVVDKLQEGDYLIIQFGHNDSKPDTVRHTEPFTTYKKNLEGFVNETKKEGAIPILFTSNVRRHFCDDCSLEGTHGDYLTAVKEGAEENDVYLIDSQAKTRKLKLEAGQERSKAYHLHFKCDIYPLRPEGLMDNTHLALQGAFTVFGLAVQGMKELDMPLS